MDLLLSRRIMKGWEAFFSVENLFDRTSEVGKTADGIVTIGTPVLAHGGIRGRFSRRNASRTLCSQALSPSQVCFWISSCEGSVVRYRLIT